MEVGGLRYNGPALDAYRNAESPYGGQHAGKWPIRVNPDDVRWAYFQDPADDCWHRLEWEHAAGLGTPFSGEAARYARQLAARSGPLARYRAGAGRAAGPVGPGHGHRAAGTPDGGPAGRRARRPARPGGHAGGRPGRLAARCCRRGTQPPPAEAALHAVPDVHGDDEDPEEIFDDPAGGDFYADAFEILE